MNAPAMITTRAQWKSRVGKSHTLIVFMKDSSAVAVAVVAGFAGLGQGVEGGLERVRIAGSGGGRQLGGPALPRVVVGFELGGVQPDFGLGFGGGHVGPRWESARQLPRQQLDEGRVGFGGGL